MNEITLKKHILEFQQSGLLIRSDKNELDKFRDIVNKAPRFSSVQPVLQRIIIECFELGSTANEHALKAERSRVATLIKLHPAYLSLLQRWDDVTWFTLVDEFKTLAPLSFIKEVTNYELIHHDIPQFHQDEALDIEKFLAIEQKVRAAIKEIPLGLGYASKILDAIKKNSAGHIPFYAIRAGIIPEIFSDGNPDDLIEIDEDLSRQIYTGFRLFKTKESFDTIKYSSWYELTAIMCLVQPEVYEAFRLVFPIPTNERDKYPKDIAGVIKLAGAILANFYEHYPDHISEDLILPIIYGLLRELPKTTDSLDFSIRKWLWGVGYSMSTGGWSLPTFVAEKLSWWRNIVEQHILPAGIVTAITSLVTTCGIAIYNALDRLSELIFLSLAKVVDDSYSTITEYFYLNRLFLSSFLPEQRRRPKAVWALLFTNDFVKLTPGEKFMMGCAMMKEPLPVTDYSVWAEHRLQAMRDLGIDLETEPAIPIRDFRIPEKPFVPDEEIADLAPLMTEGRHVNEIAATFTKKLIDMGVPRGMDGLWFSTDNRIARSIERYSSAIPPVEDIIKTVTLRSAHALADKFPAMYRGATVLTPRAAMNKIKCNDYSPALPYIPRYRTRKDLARVGIWEATIKEAERLLRKGEHPGECAHCFVKSQVVKLDKMIQDETALRTVTASTLLSNVIQYVSTVEITRRQPPLDAFVMNAVPRSEGGFRPFYEELATYAHVFAADVTKFDSQLIPTVTDALIELRSIGYDGSIVKPIAASQIRASYLAMRFAKLVDLRTGQVFDKIKGLLTGQGNTSVDNRDAFRILIISAWSLVTGRAPSMFWEKNVIGNAGDDDAIGTDEPEVWPHVIEAIKTRFGMQVRVETEGFWNLNLVGLTVKGVPEHSIKYYHIHGHPVPSFSIMADAKSLLHKRTDWTMNISNAPSDIKFLMKHLDGIIGSAYQTAHLIDVYELLGDQYITEIQQVLLRFYDKVIVEVTRDDVDKPIEYFVHLGTERQRYQGKTSNIRNWLKSHRFPKYNDIMRIWLKPQDIANTKMTKDHRKLLSWNPVVPFQERTLYGILDLRRKMYDWIPNHVARALPEFRGVDPTFGMRNPDYVIEKFVWLSLYEKLKQVPPAALFRTRLRENPYGSACDPVGFLSWLSNDENLNDLASSDLESLRAQLVAVTIVYWFIENIFKFFKDVPLLAILYHAYAFSTRDVNRLYAALNYVHMIATGASSSIISNMMPPDPYAWMKRFAVVMTYLFPRRWYRALLPGLRHITSVLPMMVDIWASADAIMGPRPFRSLYTQIEVPPNWAMLVAMLRPLVQDPANLETIAVFAPTGTGKSTGFIAALMYNCNIIGTIWLLCPTISSRDIYENDFLPSNYFQILSSGIDNRPECRVKVLTYGHARNRIQVEASPQDLIIFDEVHKGEVEMMACWYKFQPYKRITITATETPFMPKTDHRFNYPGEKRFQVQAQVVNQDFATLVTEIVEMDPVLMERALIMCPDYDTVQNIIQTLSRISINCSALSSYEPVPQRSGCIAATTIADQALTITPPPTCLIDLGLTLKIDYDYSQFMPRSKASHIGTSPATATQRLGRVGRAGNSRAFIMPIAGTGPPETPRLTPFALLDDTSLFENLLAWFKIALACEVINDHKNIFRFLTLMPDMNPGMVSPHTIATCFYIVARQSDNQIGESLWREWLELRINRSQHEILNIIIDNVLDLGFGDPLLGDWQRAIGLVSSGFLGCKVNNRYIPMTCMVIINNVITYCGARTASILDTIPRITHFVGLLPSEINFWRSLNSVIHYNVDITTVHNDLQITNMEVVPFDLFSQTQENFSNYFDMQLSTFLLSVSTLYTSALKKIPKHTRIVINQDAGVALEDLVLAVVTSDEISVFANNIIELPSYGLGNSTTNIGMVLTIASACNDKTIVVWGDVPPQVFVLLSKFIQPGFLTNMDKTWAVISPRYARVFAHSLQLARRRDLESAFINSIQKRILLPSVLTQYNALPSEIKCAINVDNHLIGVV
uniref:RNA-dependent RNA polymerase n=1 Tax=Rhizoctonia cerealis hypovirus TaxID=3068667 RepID=A0AA51GGT6_9VIRU|nr:MAG: RNA-dependent RNA polymerase [Rhizoctonia cerealis hypovirus]